MLRANDLSEVALLKFKPKRKYKPKGVVTLQWDAGFIFTKGDVPLYIAATLVWTQGRRAHIEVRALTRMTAVF